MKKAISKVKAITAGLILILTMGFIQPVLSADKGENPVEFKFISNLVTGPVFQLKLNNANEGEFLIKVKDAQGNLLHSETLKGINVSRKYQVAVDLQEIYDGYTIRFEITQKETKQTLIYNISRNSRLVEDIVVARL